ncbi:endogenous retrovirus group K member 21 Gag polyprotein-like isoform 1-T2 [Podargus strigoides]
MRKIHLAHSPCIHHCLCLPPPTPLAVENKNDLSEKQLNYIIEKLEEMSAGKGGAKIEAAEEKNVSFDVPSPPRPPPPPLCPSPDNSQLPVPFPHVSQGCLSCEHKGRLCDPAHRWRGVIRDALIEGEGVPMEGPMAFPVFQTSEQAPYFTPIEWKMLKEAKKAVTRYGLKSLFAQSILNHLFTAQLLIPHDSKMIVNTVLTPSQQLQFYHKWTMLCDAAAAQPRQPNDPLYQVTSQMLQGSGPYAATNWQVHFQTPVLQLSQELALKALQGIHDPGQSISVLTSVRQRDTEPFSEFVDRLRLVLNNNPDLEPGMKATFLDMLAFENANEKTKRILCTLPKDADVGSMLELAE